MREIYGEGETVCDYWMRILYSLCYVCLLDYEIRNRGSHKSEGM